jgi:hypothetical protein
MRVLPKLLTVCRPEKSVDVVVEGQISDVVHYGDGNGTMTVMGIVIEIPEGVPIATPTAVLTMAQFADARSLPGRWQPGFVGAAAVVNGTSTKGRITASDVFVTPAPNILVGQVTRQQPFQVNGVSVKVLDDARIPGEPLKSILGVPVVPGTVPVGAAAIVEGYFGNTGTLHAVMVEVEDGKPV